MPDIWDPIADEQQVYDLSYLDDQLVLGIKGTLSVVELKVIRQRLLAGHPRSSAAVDAKEWKFLALSKPGEFAAERGDSIRFMECIGEQGDAQRSRHCEARACKRRNKAL